LITAALAALPLISEVGQGVAKTLKQDLAGFLALGQAGQNVPGAASSTAPAAQGAPPQSFPALAQAFRHDLSSLLLTAQGAAGSLAGADPSTIASDLIQAINPNGDGTISKTQFETAFQTAAGAVGGSDHPSWSQAATHLADHLFGAIDTNGDGRLTAAELTAYIGQVRQNAAAKYQAVQSFVAGIEGQLQGLVSGASAKAAATSTSA
jgi:hypothetical protein